MSERYCRYGPGYPRKMPALVVVIISMLLLLSTAVGVMGLVAFIRTKRQGLLKTPGFDTPGYLWKSQDDRARRSGDQPGD